MKKILFSFLRMNTAGTEKSLMEILRRLGDGYEIHFAVAYPEGTGLSMFPDTVKVHAIEGYRQNWDLMMTPKREIPRRLLTLRWRTGIPAAYHYLRSVIKGSLAEYAEWLLREDRPGGRNANPDLDCEFDLSVDFPGPPGEYIEYFATNHVKAKRFAAFIHFDLDWVKHRPKTSKIIYDRCDKVFCVSELALQQYRRYFPENAHKGCILHNFTDNAAIIARSEEKSNYTPVTGALNIVMVGRLTYAKGVEFALYALKALVDSGVDAHWHFVGGYVEYSAVSNPYRELAEKLNLTERAHFTAAEVKNPYPYMRGADVYVQTSRYEGYGITMAEACILGVPIVATEAGAARSLLEGRPNAILLPALKKDTDPSEIAPSIADAIRRASMLPRLAPSTEPLTPLSELQPFVDLLKN